MAIAVETYATTAMGGGSTITKPTGLTVGDLLLAIVADDQYDYDALAAPAGWTTLGRYTQGTDKRVEVLVCYIVATSTETAASNFTFTNASGGILYRISGAATTHISGGEGSVMGEQTLVIVFGASGDNSGGYNEHSNYYVSGGDSPTMTERFDSHNTGLMETLGVADGIYNSSSSITGYGVTMTYVNNNPDTEFSYLIKIPAVQNASASNTLYQTSPVTFATLTGSTQQPVNNFHEVSPDFPTQSGQASVPTAWTTITKS